MKRRRIKGDSSVFALRFDFICPVATRIVWNHNCATLDVGGCCCSVCRSRFTHLWLLCLCLLRWRHTRILVAYQVSGKYWSFHLYLFIFYKPSHTSIDLISVVREDYPMEVRLALATVIERRFYEQGTFDLANLCPMWWIWVASADR